MNDYKYTDKCDEISGFGGAYEEACRKMVVSAMEWFDKHKNSDPQFITYENLYGLINEKNEEAEKLTTHMNNSINGEATGAMMQTCLDHAMYAKKNGWSKYMQEMEKNNDTTTTCSGLV